MTHFYSHLIKTDSLVVALNELELSDEEKSRLVGIIDSSLHHAILDAVLSELSEKDKEKFLQHVVNEDNEKVWKFLNEKVDNIEGKIKKTADELTAELHKDIKEVKK